MRASTGKRLAAFVATLGPVFEALVVDQLPAVGAQAAADHVVEIAVGEDQHVLKTKNRFHGILTISNLREHGCFDFLGGAFVP